MRSKHYFFLFLNILSLSGQVFAKNGDLETLKLRIEELEKFKSEQSQEVDHLKAKVESQAVEIKNLKSLIAPESCSFASGPSSSATEVIDPDGQFFGNPPIEVKCDYMNGKTIIGEEVTYSFKQCQEFGCLVRDIEWDEVTKQQLVKLIESSASCSQKITFDCFSAPLKLGIEDHFLLNDRNGEFRVLPPLQDESCNENWNFWRQNVAEINGTYLPITAIRYGFIKYDFQRLNVTLGPIVCDPARPRTPISKDIKAIETSQDVMEEKIGNLKTAFEDNRNLGRKVDEAIENRLTKLEENYSNKT